MYIIQFVNVKLSAQLQVKIRKSNKRRESRTFSLSSIILPTGNNKTINIKNRLEMIENTYVFDKTECNFKDTQQGTPCWGNLKSRVVYGDKVYDTFFCFVWLD